MAATVADLPEERFSELARSLAEFSPAHPADEHEPPQYWEVVAERLRRDQPNKFSSYTNHRLAGMDEHSLLQDLARRAFPLVKLKKLLQEIQCRPGLNVFEDEVPPIIIREPVANIEVIEGHPIILEVEAECRPGQPIYQWFKDRTPVTGQDKPTLLIKNAIVANSGNYICRVTNPYVNNQQKGVVFSKYVKVTVEAKREVSSSNPRILQEVGDRSDAKLVSTPKIIRHPSPVTVQLNSKAELECVADGAAVYDWYKDDKFLKSTGRANGRLVFDKAAVSDAGTYYCVAVGDKGGKTTSKTAKFTVESGITLKIQPKGSEVHVNKDFTLTCLATNNYDKKMKYEWFQKQGRGDSRIGVGEKFIGKASTKRDADLKFYCRVSLEEHPDVFVTSRIATVKVKTVWITEQPKSVKRAIGDYGILHCQAEGQGDLTYMWFKSDTKNGEEKPVANGEFYLMRHLSQRDWGYYCCRAGNRYENAVSRKVRVSAHLPTAATLTRRPKSTQQHPLINIVKQPWSQVIPLGGRFRLLCRAVSSVDEPLHYQWYFSGNPIHGETKEEFINENIGNLDFGPYWCIVNIKSSSLPAVSTSARIEQSHDTLSYRQVPKNGRNPDQEQAEMELITRRKERFAREKVALLIGNQRYDAKELNDLKSPEGDIKELCRELENLDFKVISLVNLRHSEIMNALEEFYKMLAVPGIYALFYYSGHGFRVQEGRNYIVPVDATKPLQLDHNIYVDGIIKQMQEKYSRAFVILDCCRSVVDDQNIIPDDRLASGSLHSLGVANMSNYVEISSCVDKFTADDNDGAAAVQSPTSGFPKPCHSFFNKALREALTIEEKKNMSDIHDYVQKKFIEEGLEQRPQYRGSFADRNISLRDAIMMDDPTEHEHHLDEVLTTYNQAHAIPDQVVLKGEKHLGELAKLARIEVDFRNEFSNVLCVMTKLVLLQNDMKTTTVKIEYDLDIIKRQFPEGEHPIVEQGACFMDSCLPEEVEEEEEEEEEGGQGEYESFIATTLKVFNINRLRSKPLMLNFVLDATVGTEGTDKVATVRYQVQLTKHFLND